MLFILSNISIDFSLIDDKGITIAIVGYIVVFSALVALFYLFSLIPKILKTNVRKKLKKEGKLNELESSEETMTGEVNAAISTALFLYFNEMHDEESGVLTVKRISRRYSPWSSKIYNVMNNQLQKKQ